MTPLPGLAENPMALEFFGAPAIGQTSALSSVSPCPVPTHVMADRELGTPLLPKKAQGHE